MTRLTWRLWALLVAVVAGVAALFVVYFGDGDAGAPESPTHPAAASSLWVAEGLPDLLRPVRPSAVAADFVGL